MTLCPTGEHPRLDRAIRAFYHVNDGSIITIVLISINMKIVECRIAYVEYNLQWNRIGDRHPLR